MFSKIFKITLALVFAITVFTSCEKEGLNEVLIANQEIAVEEENQAIKDYSNYEKICNYYLDEKKVDEKVLTSSKSDLLIFVKDTIKEVTEEYVTEIYGFTTESKYIDFGIRYDYKLEEQLTFEKRMREYVVANNIEQIYNETGKIPQSYLDYEESLVESVFNIDLESKSFFTTLFKEYYLGPAIIMKTCVPSLYVLGWNNAVSAFEFCGLYGTIAMYDDAFYRKPILTYNGWASRRWSLEGHYADNKANSVLCWW